MRSPTATFVFFFIALNLCLVCSHSSLRMLQTSESPISDSEKQQIDEWITIEGLNEFGDSPNTMYMGGTPLFDERTGKRIDRYEYLVNKFPAKPWEQSESPISDSEKQQIDEWINIQRLNQFGDAPNTMYVGGTPLFDERTGESIDRYEYLVNKFPAKPWERSATALVREPRIPFRFNELLERLRLVFLRTVDKP